MAPATAESKPPTPTESCGVCTDFKVLRRKRFPMVATTTQSTKNPSTPLAMGVAGVMGTAVLATADSPPTPDLDAVTVPSYSPMPCPPDSSELGASTWTFLHTMAAYYPESPSVEDKQAMRSFVSGLARFYPCWHCASHLQEHLKTNPPIVDSNSTLSDWFCKVHNNVNARQGKPEFDCSQVFARWRTQRKECTDEE